MLTKMKTRILAILLCAALLTACLPITAFAESVETTLTMTQGDVITDFASGCALSTSTDPSVAWVDENGSLNALKAGTTDITVCSYNGTYQKYSVSVDAFSDGSPVVGSLKILARYNDSMPFYDGHVYLLFTSYQDGVEIRVPDLYGGYEISDRYYADIREDISNGSNHTGSDTDKYFTFSNEMTSMSLNRGEIVTIGMYRGFDLTVPQAALGAIENSSVWTELEDTVKTSVMNTVLQFLDSGTVPSDDLIEKLKTILEEAGVDYTKVFDGVVEGGVCFNRELYNQKLEWDQYENVTYELDITKNQLDLMQMYLGGNKNNFNILKNSCATVALRAWNAAVGTRNGADTAYKLICDNESVFSFIDAPKGVRDNIVQRLPGYWLNNSEGVAEPGAGFQDDTGFVYVSAPKAVTPVSYLYDNDAITVDESKTKMAALVNIAKSGQDIFYGKDHQEIGVSILTDTEDQKTTISGIEFTVGGDTVSLDTAPEGGIWFKAKVENPVAGEDYYVTDADGNALPSSYEDGCVSFYAASLPVAYQIIGSAEGAQNILRTVIVNGDKADVETKVYYKNGDEDVLIDSFSELAEGTKIYIKTTFSADEFNYLLRNITLNGTSVFDNAHFDAEEGAYYAIMPAVYSNLTITYEIAIMSAKEKSITQVFAGDTLEVSDYAALLVNDDDMYSDAYSFYILANETGAVESDGKQLKAVSEGKAVVWIASDSNRNIGELFLIEVYENKNDLVKVIYTEDEDFSVSFKEGEDGKETDVPYSGYLVRKGTILNVTPTQEDSKAISGIYANGKLINPGESITADCHTLITVTFASAEIQGVPRTVSLKEKGDTYQLDANVKYTGIHALLPVYDSSISYKSSDPLISVDENGLLTVAEDIPKSGKAVIVTAYAGSSNNKVTASCKVVVGEYQGERIVGNLTISARPIHKAEPVAHAAATFTTYDDLDLSVSYYHYHKPNDKYNALMADYDAHPENSPSDPALYNDNELGLTDRESYFDVLHGGAGSDPQPVSLKAGESISLSNYSFDSTNLITVMMTLENAPISYSPAAQALVNQIKRYLEGEDIDGTLAYDSLIETIMQIYSVINMTGENPASGHSDGGMDINREIYNQFRRNDSQMPNNYYTVEITADELTALQGYLADPGNNYYSLMVKNCASGALDIWNTTLYDRPELQLSANLSGLGNDPESLYYVLGLMRYKFCLDGEGGVNFYPRTCAYSDAVKDVMALIDAIGEVEYTDECKARIDEARKAYDALSDIQKEQVRNYTTLTDAESAYDALKKAADKAAFDEYKNEQKDAADALLKEGDDNVCKLFVEVTKAIIDAIEYDDSLTLEENEAIIDEILSRLETALETYRSGQKDDPVLGDADGNGVVNVGDATYIQMAIARMAINGKTVDYDSMDKNSAEFKAADVDKNGIVNIGDATYIQMYIAHMPVPEGIGEPVK